MLIISLLLSYSILQIATFFCHFSTAQIKANIFTTYEEQFKMYADYFCCLDWVMNAHIIQNTPFGYCFSVYPQFLQLCLMFSAPKISFPTCWKLARMVIRYYLSSTGRSFTQHYVLHPGRQLAAELHLWYSEENFYFLCATLHPLMSTEDFFNFRFSLTILRQIQSHSRIFLIRKHFWVDIYILEHILFSSLI